MKADHIERESIRNLLGVIDRVDYFSSTDRAEAALRKGERFLTRDAITELINYILELEHYKQSFVDLESAVMTSADSKRIFTSCPKRVMKKVKKNGSLM